MENINLFWFGCAFFLLVASLLLTLFGSQEQQQKAKTTAVDGEKVAQLQQQCARLRAELEQQSEQLEGDFQKTTLEKLQTLLTNFPTARKMAEVKPNLPAKNLAALFTPLENLLDTWGIELIGAPWEQVTYDPQLHQPDTDDIAEGELVYVHFVGYREGEKVLFPAKISRTLPAEAGLDLAIEALQQESGEVEEKAYLLLRERTEAKVKQALQKYIPYQFFECLETLNGHLNGVWSVVITPDGQKLVSGSYDNTIKIWRLKKRKLLSSFEIAHNRDASYPNRAVRPSLAITPDGQKIVGGVFHSPYVIKTWDMNTGQVTSTLDGKYDSLTAEMITPDGLYAIYWDWHKMKIRNINTGKFISTLENYELAICSVAITPDQRKVICGMIQGYIKTWEIMTTGLLHELHRHRSDISAVAITPDGKKIISASGSSIKISDIETGKFLSELEGHSRIIPSIVVTPDGKKIISGSWDKTIKIWDLNTGALLSTLEGHSDGVFSVAVTPNGQNIVSGSRDNTIKVWGLKDNC